MSFFPIKTILSALSMGGVMCLAGLAGDQPPAIQPQPVYTQCTSLAAGGSTDDEAARSLSSLKDKDPRVREQSALGAGRSCDKRAVEPLIELLKDSDPAVRRAAVEALGKLGDADAIQPLGEMIGDQDWQVRQTLISALVSFNDSTAKSLVVNGISNAYGAEATDPNDMRVRCSAILTLNQLNNPVYSRKPILFLYSYLQSSNDPIRRIAEQTMIELKNTRNGSIELIALLKQSQNPEIRCWSAQWIGKLKIENGREALQDIAANDRNQKVRAAATEALKALGNRQD